MGLFFNYSKPGPGVPKDAPKKNAFFRFFGIFFRKFWHYVKSNLLYLLCSIPFAIIVYILVMFIISNFSGGLFNDVSDKTTALMYLLLGVVGFNFYISVFGMGPVTAGETYVMRNFSQEEHAWVWSDFKDNLKSNFKQAIVVFVIDIAVLFCSTVALVFYGSQTGAISWLKIVVVWILLIYSMMHLYIYPMMVTFDLKLKYIFKNSFLFAIGNILKNILALILLLFIHIGVPMLIIFFAGNLAVIFLLVYLLLELTCLHAFSLMLVNFIIFPKIKSIMIDRENENK